MLPISVAFYFGWNFLENVYIPVQQDKGFIDVLTRSR